MYCDDCGTVLDMDHEEYLKRLKHDDTVPCDRCAGGVGPTTEVSDAAWMLHRVSGGRAAVRPAP